VALGYLAAGEGPRGVGMGGVGWGGVALNHLALYHRTSPCFVAKVQKSSQGTRAGDAGCILPAGVLCSASAAALLRPTPGVCDYTSVYHITLLSSTHLLTHSPPPPTHTTTAGRHRARRGPHLVCHRQLRGHVP
jgi:hypothetical protein